MDKDFNFLRVNKAYAEADDKNISYFVGKNHFELYPNKENEKIFRKVIRSGKPFYIKGKPFIYPNNPERGVSYWDWSLIPIKDKNKRVNSLVLTLRDVTDREIAKQKLEQSYKRTNFYKDLLAHDMRNILSSVQFSIDLLKKKTKKPVNLSQINSTFKNIENHVDKGAALISNVQKLSKIDDKTILIKNVDLKEILKEAISLIQEFIKKENVNLNVNFSDTPINVKAGELLLDAFENILLNAVKHNNNKKKHIWINISKTKERGNEYIKLEFKDNGIGFPDKNANIFSGEYNSQSSSGMGIGLTLVKAIIKAYGGRIWVEDRIEGDHTQGSNFIILLRPS